MDDPNINTHHLVLGEREDFLTGKTITDTLDERYRQKLARHLVLSCGFNKKDLIKDEPLIVQADQKKAEIKIDLLAVTNNSTRMMINFAPGSITTRLRCTLALSRIIRPYQVPIVVVTNGEGAEILDGFTGHVIGNGLEAIPHKQDLPELIDNRYKEIPKKHFILESRIAYAFIVDGSCPCDDDICIL